MERDSNPEDVFSPDVTETMGEISTRMEDAKRREEDFFAMWAELTPEAKQLVIKQAKQFAESGGSGLSPEPRNSDNAMFYERIVREYGDGTLK